MSKIIKCKNCGQPINEQIRDYVKRFSSKGGLTTKKNHGKDYFSKLAKKRWSKVIHKKS